MNAVMEVVGDSNNEIRENNIGSIDAHIGSIDAHKQAARRFKRKMQKDSTSLNQDSQQTIPDSHLKKENSQQIPASYNSMIIDSQQIDQSSQQIVQDFLPKVENSESNPLSEAVNTVNMMPTPTSSGVVFVPPSLYENCEVVSEFPADFQFVVSMPDQSEVLHNQVTAVPVGNTGEEGKEGGGEDELVRTRRQWA